MSNCGACLSGIDVDYDPHGFNDVQYRRARKPHRCCECAREIQKGATYELVTVFFDGEFSKANTCLLCSEIRDHFRCGGSYAYGFLWEGFEDIWPEFTLGCMEERDGHTLSAAAKDELLRRWRKWKGLAV